MSLVAVIVDTSYLLELFKVPGRFEVDAVEEVKNRFGAAIDNGYAPLARPGCGARRRIRRRFSPEGEHSVYGGQR